MITRISEIFYVQIPLLHLFEYPTVAGLSAAVVAADPTPGHSERLARALRRLRTMSPEAKEALRRTGTTG